MSEVLTNNIRELRQHRDRMTQQALAELTGVSRVLTAAAATYLAGAVSALLQLAYWAMRAGLLGGRRD